MIQVNIHEAKTNLSKLLAMASKGEQVVICKHNIPYVELTAFEDTRKNTRKLGTFKGLVEISDDFDEPMSEEDLKLWEEGHEDDPMRSFMQDDKTAT